MQQNATGKSSRKKSAACVFFPCVLLFLRLVLCLKSHNHKLLLAPLGGKNPPGEGRLLQNFACCVDVRRLLKKAQKAPKIISLPDRLSTPQIAAQKSARRS
jgi:hypothetical protein